MQVKGVIMSLAIHYSEMTYTVSTGMLNSTVPYHTTSVSILVFLGLSVLDLGQMYATDRRQTASSLNVPA